MKAKYFEDLEIWKMARELTKLIYFITNNEKLSKDFGLKEQIRRASVSIMSNIAEGFERGGNQEFIQFLYIAKGSCAEVRCQLYILLDEGYISKDQFEKISAMTKKISIMLSNFIKYLKKSGMKGEKYLKQSKTAKEELDEFLEEYRRNKKEKTP